ncbi:MAG: iron-sulfur cluster repair di-iron protein [Pirellulaceae bacterium]|nr:iron-sulfur cluster repair di-iron protein [Pirellulaceae bacterium]
MPELNLDTTVGRWVAERPNTSRVFEALQIDYCCGGNQPLGQACAERRLDAGQVLRQLEQAAEAAAGEPAERWGDRSLAELCDHIERTHHAYLKEELPRLQAMIGKVVAAHAANHPELAEVQQAFADLQAELGPHMFKEERILFPAIRQLEQSASQLALPFGTVANPIRMMEHEHDNAGTALSRMRRATSGYRAPADACNTYRALLDGLARLELDMHQHVHKENNILFPRAIEREHSLESVI